MRLKLIILSFLLIIFHSVGAEDNVCTAYHLESEPDMNSTADESHIWSKIPYIKGFSEIGSNGKTKAKKETFFKIGYTQNALYFLVECDDEKISEILDSHKDKESVFSDDSIEMFILPEAGGNYFQFAANAAGSKWNTPPSLWDWKTKALKKENCWILEIKIPFEIFRIMPNGGDSWRFNICRNIPGKSGRSSSSWSPVEKSFHEQDNWGCLIFEK